MDVLDPAFPKQVRAARALLGMNQSQFARMLGVSQPFIARLERGERLGQASKLRQMREELQGLGFTFTGGDTDEGDAEDAIWVGLRGPHARALRDKAEDI